MSRARCCRFLMPFAAALTMGLWFVPAAHAVQASGSIQLIPSQQTDLLKNQDITLDVSFVNNSTTSPPSPVSPREATLTGPITVDYACTSSSCDCTTKDPTRLSFVSCSIVGAPAGVVSCVDAGAGTGQVIINLAPGGLDLAADPTPVFLAQITLQTDVDPLPLTRFRAGTDVCALSSCLALGVDCATCAAEGCSFVRGPEATGGLLSCKHGCPNRISFFSGLDHLHFNTLVHVPGYDPATDSFTLTLTDGGTVFTVSVPNVPQVDTRVYMLKGPGNSTTPGIESIEITRRTGTGPGGVDCTDNWFKIIVEGWGDMNLAQMPDPMITVDLSLGTSPVTELTDTETWTSIPPGATGSKITAVEKDFPVRSPC